MRRLTFIAGLLILAGGCGDTSTKTLSGPNAAAAAPSEDEMLQQAKAFLNSEDYDRAIAAYEALLKKHPSAIEGYCDLAVICELRGNLDRAEALLRKARSENDELNDEGADMVIYNALGRLYQARGDLEQAEPMFREALRLSEKLNSLSNVATSHALLGHIAMNNLDLDTAEQHLTRALALRQELGQDNRIANAYCNLAAVYQQKEDLDRAESLLNQALEHLGDTNQPATTATVYARLGIVERARGEFDQAAAHFEQSWTIYNQLGLKPDAASTTVQLATLFSRAKRYSEAIDWFLKAHDTFIELGDTAMASRMQASIDALRQLEP